jgi:23S rRNA (cytosine1962-C5)-methyltransferase
MKVFGAFPENYELIDAGNGYKLERWGHQLTIRPEHQAYFKSEMPLKEWRKLAHAAFVPLKEGGLNGTWEFLKNGIQESWTVPIGACTFQLEFTSNKHVGLFPEQQIHWELLSKLSPEDHFLNLFAYTGASSCFARSSGAQVTHVDAVKAMNEWGKTNMHLSQLNDIRWIQEDALKFVDKEIKRGNSYQVIQMDPPAWGMGAKREKWKLEDLLPELIEKALQCLVPGGKLIVNTYSPKLTLERLEILTENHLKVSKTDQLHELWLESTSGKKLYFGNVLHLVKNH